VPARIAQLVEHFHGKEGVTSSSLVPGSREAPAKRPFLKVAFSSRCETYEEAIEELVTVGLLRRYGGSIRPTDAALRAEEIKR
jgi:hypothetical protein